MRSSHTFGMAVGAACLVVALITLRVLFDRDRTRPRWATLCLATLVVVAAAGGVMTGFAVNREPVGFLSAGRVYYLAGCLRWFAMGLLLPLAFSGQWSGNKPEK